MPSRRRSHMRHRNAGYKLGRNTSHRRAMLRNLVTSVILMDRVETTITKCKATRLFNVVAPRYTDRQGGYLRITRTGPRKGDAAEMAFIELLGAEQELNEKAQKRAEARTKKREELQKQLEEQQAAAGEEPKSEE